MHNQWDNWRANEVTAMNILYLFSEGQMVQMLQMCTAEKALWDEVQGDTWLYYILHDNYNKNVKNMVSKGRFISK